MKKLKDYLHFYLGCELFVVKTKEIVTFDDLQSTDRWPVWTRNIKYCNVKNCVASGFRFKEIKPILRPLSDMTKKEHLHMMANFPSIDKDVNMAGAEKEAAKVHYLLSRRFDLFRLIESGLAINELTLR